MPTGVEGATLAGFVALVQLVPAGLFAPFASLLADRHRPAAVSCSAATSRRLAMGSTAAVLLAGGPSWLAYLSAATAATAVTITRPTLAVLTPALARAPAELTARTSSRGGTRASACSSRRRWPASCSRSVPPGFVFLGMAVAVFAGAILVLPVRGPAVVARTAETTGARELFEGFRVLRREPAARLLVGLLVAQYVAIGMLDASLRGPRDRNARHGAGRAGISSTRRSARAGPWVSPSPHRSSGAHG